MEKNIFRSSAPKPLNFPFLASLHLKTAVYLSSGCNLNEKSVSFFQDQGIDLICVPFSSTIAEESVIEVLHLLKQKDFLPILLFCDHGRNATGTIVPYNCSERI